MKLEKIKKEMDAVVLESIKLAELQEKLLTMTKKKVMWQTITLTLAICNIIFILLVLASSL